MDDEGRRRRREAAHRHTIRRRRAVAGGVLAGVVLLIAVAAGSGGGGSKRAAAPVPPKPAELPAGGRSFFPRYRVVAYYGAPQSAQLGELGIGSPDRAGAKLARQARAYQRPDGRRVLPAFELLVAVATAAPGADGLYRSLQSPTVIRRYLAAARRAHAVLILDIQPGREDFAPAVRRLAPFLAEPDVELALDPEWSVRPGELPGKVIGSTDARDVNAAADYLSTLTRERRLPEKLLLVHQFTETMIRNRATLRQPPGVALVLNVDGVGSAANKIAKYRELTRPRPRFHSGFKLFYHEDTGLIPPRRVLRLRPQPELVVYE